jgi:hypothetical protein
MNDIVGPTFQHEAILFNPCKHYFKEGKHNSLVTHPEGQSAIRWFSKIAARHFQ